MPNDSLSDAIKEAYALAPSNVAALETLQLYHPGLGDAIFIVKNRTDLTMKLETGESVLFTGCGFSMALPASGDGGVQELTLTIDNVDRRISNFLKAASNFQTPVEVTYRPYLSNDLETPQMNPPLSLYLTDVSVNLFSISGKANFGDLVNKKFPNDYYTRSRFPSLGS